jgi:hypothetical protein
MRSCSLSVLVKQTAEEITSVDSGRLILAGQGQSDGWIRGPQLERSVRPMSVVVLDVDPQDLLKVSAADNQQPVQTLGTHRPDPPFRVSVRVRPPAGVTSIWAPSEPSTSSNARVNLASRSRSRNRSRRPHSPSTSSRLRACWVTHGPSGLAVTPAK